MRAAPPRPDSSARVGRRPAAVFVLATVIGVAQAGCSWPIPGCEERVETLELPIFGTSDSPLHDDGSFDVADRTYASCNEFCSTLSGLVELRSCAGPAVTRELPNGDKLYSVTCEVHHIVCRQKELKGPTIAH
jgi:hypothetical protein